MFYLHIFFFFFFFLLDILWYISYNYGWFFFIDTCHETDPDPGGRNKLDPNVFGSRQLGLGMYTKFCRCDDSTPQKSLYQDTFQWCDHQRQREILPRDGPSCAEYTNQRSRSFFAGNLSFIFTKKPKMSLIMNIMI